MSPSACALASRSRRHGTARCGRPQRRREWWSGQRPMQRPLRRVHLLAVCQPAVPNLSGGGRGTKPPGRYSALKPPICTRQHPRQTSSRALDRPCCILDTVVFVARRLWPAQCDLRVGDATYLPRTLAATSPTSVAAAAWVGWALCAGCHVIGARYARAATTEYLHREGPN